MLKNTLILPDKVADGSLAARLLEEAIAALDVVLMLVFGRDSRAEEIVGWADQLCAKTQIDEIMNLRRVVWVRGPDVPQVQTILTRLSIEGSPRVAVLDFHDQVKVTLPESTDIDPIVLEKSFLQGQQL